MPGQAPGGSAAGSDDRAAPPATEAGAMTRPSWAGGLLLAYPPDWRARYGAELESLVQDLRDHGRRPIPMACDLLRGAVAAWLTPRRIHMSERSRSALLTVLWNWVAFAAIAAWFGHDLGEYPNPGTAQQIAAAHPALPDAYHVLYAAGIVGLAATAVAAVPFAITAARSARASGNHRTFVLMAVPPVVAAIWLGVLRLVSMGSATG